MTLGPCPHPAPLLAKATRDFALAACMVLRAGASGSGALREEVRCGCRALVVAAGAPPASTPRTQLCPGGGEALEAEAASSLAK